MSGFSAEWLTLRESYDLAARNPIVLAAVEVSLKSLTPAHIVDLGCGTGSTVRALHARLPARQSWKLVDNAPDLLAIAESTSLASDVSLHALRLDLSRDLEAALENKIDLVTISALLDLVSGAWLSKLLDRVTAHALPVYAALTYDGRIDLSPFDPLDADIVSAVNAHQRTDKGFGGPALGPSAAASAIAGFRSLGYSVISETSDWTINSDDQAMQNELLDGWSNAVRELRALPGSVIIDWITRRKAAVRDGRSTMRVGHVDFFAFPSLIR